MTRKALLEVWRSWRPYALGVAGILSLLGLYVFHLNSPAALSPHEYTAVTSQSSPSAILQHPLNAPFSLIQYFFLRIDAHNVAGVRLPAVCGALVAAMLFYFLIRRWHGRRIALLGTALFGASGWMLHVGRLAEPQILLLIAPLSLLLLASWLNTTTRRGSALLVMSIVYGIVLCIPGAVWFEAASFILLAPIWWNHLRKARWWQPLLAIIVWLGIVGVLGYALYRSPWWWREWVGLLQPLPNTVTLLSQAGHSLSFLFIRGPYAPDLWLAHIPILDVVSIACLIMGGAFYARHLSTPRTRLLGAFLLIGIGLAAVNGVRGEGFLIPTIYILVAAGVHYWLHRWYTVFPLNPLARGVGAAALVAVVGCAVAYHCAAYFVAWRHAPDTYQTFNRQL